MITELSIQAGIRNPADREGGESSNSVWEHLGGLKGCDLSLNQADCGTMEQADRLAEMCTVRPGRANPLGQESAEGLGFFWIFWVRAFQEVALQFEVHRRRGRMIRALGILACEEKLPELRLFALEENLYFRTFQLFFSPPLTCSSLQQLRRTVPGCLIIPAGKIVNYFLL